MTITITCDAPNCGDPIDQEKAHISIDAYQLTGCCERDDLETLHLHVDCWRKLHTLPALAEVAG